MFKRKRLEKKLDIVISAVKELHGAIKELKKITDCHEQMINRVSKRVKSINPEKGLTLDDMWAVQHKLEEKLSVALERVADQIE